MAFPALPPGFTTVHAAIESEAKKLPQSLVPGYRFFALTSEQLAVRVGHDLSEMAEYDVGLAMAAVGVARNSTEDQAVAAGLVDSAAREHRKVYETTTLTPYPAIRRSVMPASYYADGTWSSIDFPVTVAPVGTEHEAQLVKALNEAYEAAQTPEEKATGLRGWWMRRGAIPSAVPVVLRAAFYKAFVLAHDPQLKQIFSMTDDVVQMLFGSTRTPDEYRNRLAELYLQETACQKPDEKAATVLARVTNQLHIESTARAVVVPPPARAEEDSVALAPIPNGSAAPATPVPSAPAPTLFEECSYRIEQAPTNEAVIEALADFGIALGNTELLEQALTAVYTFYSRNQPLKRLLDTMHETAALRGADWGAEHLTEPLAKKELIAFVDKTEEIVAKEAALRQGEVQIAPIAFTAAAFPPHRTEAAYVAPLTKKEALAAIQQVRAGSMPARLREALDVISRETGFPFTRRVLELAGGLEDLGAVKTALATAMRERSAAQEEAASAFAHQCIAEGMLRHADAVVSAGERLEDDRFVAAAAEAKPGRDTAMALVDDLIRAAVALHAERLDRTAERLADSAIAEATAELVASGEFMPPLPDSPAGSEDTGFGGAEDVPATPRVAE